MIDTSRIEKALSLTQPWAWIVLHGKTIENRSWPTRFRGAVFIHASKGMTRKQYDGAVAFARIVDPSMIVPAFDALDRGGIVGCARVVDTIPPCIDDDNPSRKGLPFEGPCPRHRWHMPEQTGFVLEDITPVRFTPMAGALGFFRVPASVATEAAKGLSA